MGPADGELNSDAPRDVALSVVGVGLNPWRDAGPETRYVIEAADRVRYVLADALSIRWLLDVRHDAESMNSSYDQVEPRTAVYELMVSQLLDLLDAGESVCLVLYGHPGVMARPAHEAIRRARERGYRAVMYPAPSAVDHLIADLGVDPGDDGWQSYEATRFIDRKPLFEPRASLVLWQVGATGDESSLPRGEPPRLPELIGVLIAAYGSDHEVVIYEAAIQPLFQPRIDRVRLSDLASADIGLMSTLYVPPKASAASSTAASDSS